MTPVIILSEASIAQGSQPWRVPELSELPPITPPFAPKDAPYLPYERDPVTLARRWAVPGTRGQEHRIGGLEKQNITGAVSNLAENHELMVGLRSDKLVRAAHSFSPLSLDGPERGDLLVVGWGGTYGAIAAAVRTARNEGLSVSHAHLRHISPLHPKLEKLLAGFTRVLVPELNSGQLLSILRAQYLVDAQGLNKVQGQPFRIEEILSAIRGLCGAATTSGAV